MSHFIVLYDACVLYPAPLRDLLMRLALTDLFRAKWTNQIHDEWIRNVLKNRGDLTSEMLERTRTLMNSHVRDCLVDGYEELIEGLALPDPDDRHVLAAAIHSHSAVIVTFNLKDFPKEAVEKYGIEAQHPDDFINHLQDLANDTVCMVVKQHRLSLKNPPKTVDEYLGTLEVQSLSKTVAQLRQNREYL